MARLSWGEFRRILKKASGAYPLILIPSQTTMAAMTYAVAPRHPDADARGLVEVCAVPSPTFFRFGFPKDDFQMPNGKWARGWLSYFRILAKQKMNRRPLAKAEVIRPYLGRADYTELKKQIREANYSPEYKQYLKTKHLYRPMKGNGDPVGGKRESNTIYSLPS